LIVVFALDRGLALPEYEPFGSNSQIVGKPLYSLRRRIMISENPL